MGQAVKPCAIDGCKKRHIARGWCQMHYQRWKKHGNPLGGRTQYRDPEAAFAARTERRGECLEWTGTRTSSGYGTLRSGGKYVVAHRYSWERVNGPIPDGKDIDHTCWNRACVEPAHLRLATHAENMGNRSGANSNSISGIRGIYKEPSGSYRAGISRDGTRHTESFATQEEAVSWLKAKRDELYGEFGGRLINPQGGSIDHRN